MDTHCLKIVLVDKLCEVLETEPIEDFLLMGTLLLDCAEVDLLVCASVFVEGLVWQERMAQDLTHQNRSVVDVFSEFQKV